MLVVTLIFSGLFVAALLAVLGDGKPVQRGNVLGLAFLGLAGGMIIGSVGLMLNAALVVGIAIIGIQSDCGLTAFRRLIWSGTAVAYLILAAWAVHDMRDVPQLRARFPLASMGERLSYEGQRTVQDERNQLLPGTAAKHVEELEQLVTDRNRDSAYSSEFGPSVRSLENLHSSYLTHFVNSPGFGVGRMTPRKPYRALASQAADESRTITLPASAYDDPIRESEYRNPWIDTKSTPTAAPGRDQLGKLHLDSLLHFINQGNFGYIQNRNAVAGFKPHQFTELPVLERSILWRLDTLELISLLKHAEPMAYISRELPRMDKLREAPVRPLTEHERAMLDGLRRGEDLQVRSIPDRIRMLGAIRAAEQCLQCHEVERGTLLGAFSYKLRLEP